MSNWFGKWTDRSKNPFQTQIGEKIEKATNKNLSTESWKLIMEICELVNTTENGSKDALKAIKKRLQQNTGRNNSVIMYTLTILEACVKNCGKKFHSLAMQKDFIQDLLKLISAKNYPSPEVKRKILSLIQIWAATFKENLDLQDVVLIYNELRAKNIEFPIHDDSHIKKHVLNTESSEIFKSPSSDRYSKVVLSTEELLNLKRELELINGNIQVFGEMLEILVPKKTDYNDLKLLYEINDTCLGIKNRIYYLINQLDHEEIVSELIHYNEKLDKILFQYETFRKKSMEHSK